MTETIIRNGNTIEKNWATVARGLTFSRLTSAPDQWRYTGRCSRASGGTTGFCDLCQTPIIYRYELKHSIDGKRLWVGSECVTWYYESWQPNGLEEMLMALKQSTRSTKKEYVEQKLEKWRVAYPVFYDYLLGAERRGYYNRWLWYTDPSKTTEKQSFKVSVMRASLKNKGYLNKEELAQLAEGLATNGIFGYTPEQLKVDYSLIESFIDVFKPVKGAKQ